MAKILNWRKYCHWKAIKSPRKRGRPLTYEEMWMVYHAFKSFFETKINNSVIIVDDPYTVTSKYTGVSRTKVTNIVKSVKESGNVPKLAMPGNRYHATTVPVSASRRIREFVFERHHDGSICNAKHIAVLMKEEFKLGIPERTLQRHLVRMGFCWSLHGKKTRYRSESDRILQQRHDYLYSIRENQNLPDNEQYQLIYLDESFLHHHHGAQFSGFSDDDFVERSVGIGRRWCFIHAVMKTGLLENTFLIFEGKSRGDYHQQFDHQIFQKWFKEQLLPDLSKKSLIVMDRCIFHMVGKDSITPKQMRKEELRQWLTHQGHIWKEKWLRPRMVDEVENKRDKKTMVEIFAEEAGHKVLFLPVHHPELNPIELVWNIAKNHCAQLFSNETKFKEQRTHLEQAFRDKINLEYCTKTFEHIQKIEEKYWETDLIFDDELEIENEIQKEFF